MFSREELKFIELFCVIKQNGTIIPYESEMEHLVEYRIRSGFYIDTWESYINSKKRQLGDGFDEWFNNLHDKSDIDEVSFRDFPQKDIEISWGNEQILATRIRDAFTKYISRAKAFCAPAAKSDLGTYYEIGTAGFIAACYTYNPRENGKCKKGIRDAFNDLRKDVDNAIKAFNEAQSDEDFKCKLSAFHAGASERANMISNDTTFEMSLFVDEYNLYRAGKGATVSDKEIERFFSMFPEEEVHYGVE